MPITRYLPVSMLALAVMLSACDRQGQQEQPKPTNTAPAAPSNPLAAHDPASGAPLDPAAGDDTARPVMQMQVVLDRLGFTPGVVDGKEGASTRNALSGFQEANGLPVSGTLDEATRARLAPWANIPATRVVTIPAEFAAGPFVTIPAKATDQARLDCLCYQNLDEKLAERFHTTVDLLRTLNPRQGPVPVGDTPWFAAGQPVRVPNIGGDVVDPAAVNDPKWAATLDMLGVGTAQPKAARVVVSKSKGTLKAFDEGGKLVAVYTATMGSRRDPLPLGEWKILGIGRNPDFHYNPKLFWDVKDSASSALLKPGPNNPVGVVWIDISKPHYGIHGTPNPETIGRAESHGCVRLTNWDAARLAQMVSTRTELLFEA
jgi:lipoprotein-anchoring transpeptidase ErfK/SrfK